MARRTRGAEFIQQQLAEMEASGLGGQDAVASAQAHLDWVKGGRGAQWREWWRVAIGAVLLVGGVGLWLGAHRMTLPAAVTGPYGVVTNIDERQGATDARLLLEIIGVFTAFGGVVWLLNQIWPRRRTYSPREVRRAVITGALLVAGVVLWYLANRYDGLGAPLITGVLVVTLQTGFITRMTGPDTARYPTGDPRGDVIRFLTPWPVMLGISLAFCAWQVVRLLR